MAPDSDQLLTWVIAELPALRARIAATYRAIDRARRVLDDGRRQG